MDRKSFWYIHDCIKDDPIFVSTGRRPQRPVKYQLAAFLSRVGSDSAVKTAGVIAIAEGAVYNYCNRITTALRKLREHFLKWPEMDERDELSAAMTEYGFPGCLGSGDGSYLVLSVRPKVNGFAYWCRKKFYAVRPSTSVTYSSIAEPPCILTS